MITNEERINLVINRLNTIQAKINSYIEYANILQDKYSLDDVLPECNAIKSALLQELNSMGATWDVVNRQ